MVKSPWDEIPLIYNKHPKSSEQPIIKEEVEEIVERNFMKDLDAVSRRIAFGVVCGSLTGACFGFVEVLRDSKLMSSKKSLATQKVFRFTYLFGGFFGTYHGIRKGLNLYSQQNPEINVLTSALVCTFPLIFMPTLRSLIPYGIMLIGLDAVNGIKD